MFTKTLATALVSGLLLTGAMGGNSFAGMGGDGGGNGGNGAGIGDGGNFSWASVRNPDGTTVTSRRNSDGSRTVLTKDRTGKVIDKKVVGKKAAKKAAKKAKPRSRPWASAYDPNTRTRTTSIGNGDGTRTVITFGPFGIGIGISR